MTVASRSGTRTGRSLICSPSAPVSPIVWPPRIPPPASTVDQALGKWSRPADSLIFGVRPNSPIQTIKRAVEQAARTKVGHQGGPTGVEDTAELLDGVEILRVGVPPQAVRAVDGGERHLDERHPALDQPAGQQATLAERVPAVSVVHGGGFLVQVERLGGRRPHHLHGPAVGALMAERRDARAVCEEVVS